MLLLLLLLLQWTGWHQHILSKPRQGPQPMPSLPLLLLLRLYSSCCCGSL
jgi:hypothetical protein